MKEIWKDIPGYEGKYQVSNLGRIKGIYGKILVHNINNRGYHTVLLCKTNIKRERKLVHRLVAEAFIPNPCDKKEVDHIDACKANCSASNLMWVSRSENMRNQITIQKMWPEQARKQKSKQQKKPVIQMDLDGNEIMCWLSAIDCEIETGIPAKRIYSAAGGFIHTSSGFRWCYAS